MIMSTSPSFTIVALSTVSVSADKTLTLVRAGVAASERFMLHPPVTPQSDGLPSTKRTTGSTRGAVLLGRGSGTRRHSMDPRAKL